MTHGAPYYIDGKFSGIVAADFKLSTLQQFLERWPALIGRRLIIDDQGHIVADSIGTPVNVIRKIGDMQIPALRLAVLQGSIARNGAGIEVAGFVTMARHTDRAPWQLVLLVTNSQLRSLLWPQLVPYAMILAVLGVTFALSLYALRHNFIMPSLGLVDYLQRLSRDDRALEPPVPVLWKPWVDMVSRTFRENHEAHRQLQTSAAFKTAIVENAMLAVITMDTQGRIVEFNRAAEQIFGAAAMAVLGRDLAETIIPERFREAHHKGLQRHLETQNSQILGMRLEFVALHASGHEFPIELTICGTPVDGQRYYTAFIADLTQRRRAEEEVARQREALRQSEKLSAMGALLAGVAHELNNPLAILMGRATLLEQKAHGENVRADAARIRAAAERCGRIVRTFLSMARQKPPERKRFRLNDVVSGTVDLLAYNLRSADVEFTVRLSPSLPGIEMDPDQIGQVLINLIVNAQHALAGQAAPRRLQLETGEEAGWQFVRVSDNGPGVPPEIAERIFEPFFTTKAEGTGTGIGLSVSRAILREHGGELVLVPSTSGATFRVRLPAQSVEPKAPPAAEEVAAGGVAQAGYALVIDDEPEVADLLADILGSTGYSVHVAASGREALEWLAHHRCDLLLSDIRMPDMDGLALWRALRKQYPDVVRHMAFVTGDTLSSSIAPFIAETGLPCLEKPFSPEEVLQLAVRIERTVGEPPSA